MSPKEVYDLLTEVQRDYAGMVRDLNKLRHLTKEVDPWSLPLMQHMQKARRDLGMVAGVDLKKEGLQ